MPSDHSMPSDHMPSGHRSPRLSLDLTAQKSTQCKIPPALPGHAMAAPGPAAGMLVATHFVYSMALKRKRTFTAFAWDAPAQPIRGNRTTYANGDCWARSDKGIIFGHTFFAQLPTKAVVCALPAAGQAECSCCSALPSVSELKNNNLPKMQSTSGYPTGGARKRLQTLEGCDDYQMFWD